MEQIALKWNDFEENVKSAFKDFRDVLNDVTLYCGGQKVCANRLVLCACSQVFRTMLLHPELAGQSQPSVLLLWDTSMDQLNLILDFMYFGEIKVSESGLNSFLQLAERLRVKGLCGMGGGGGGGSNNSSGGGGGGDGGAEDSSHHRSRVSSHEDTTKMEWTPGKKPRLDLGYKPQATTKPLATRPSTKQPQTGAAAAVLPSLAAAATADTTPINNTTAPTLREVHIKEELVPVLDYEEEEEEEDEEHLGYIVDENSFGYDAYGFEYSDSAGGGGGRGGRRAKVDGGEGGGGGPFQCSLCLKRYKSAGSLQNHRSLYHRNEISKQGKQPPTPGGVVMLAGGGGGGSGGGGGGVVGHIDLADLDEWRPR